MAKLANSISPIARAARTLAGTGLLAAGLSVGSAANAAITFVFDYSDNNGKTEFIGAANADRRAALETAGTLFSNYFGSLFTNSGTVTLAVEGVNESCAMGCTLAYAGSNSTFGNGAGFGNGEVVRNILVNGVDLNGAANDGVVGVNWGASWEKDPNVSVAAQNTGNFDLYAALIHEFTHALGFSSALQENGSEGSSTGNQVGGLDYAGFWNKFDEFKTNCAGADLIDHSTGLTNQTTYNAAKTSAMCFGGAAAVAANGGNAVHLYAPALYSAGSTGSHLDGGVGNFPTAMMKFDRDANIDEPRTYNGVEIGVLTDIGYTLQPIPEPATIAMMLAGLGLVGWRGRKARA